MKNHLVGIFNASGMRQRYIISAYTRWVRNGTCWQLSTAYTKRCTFTEVQRKGEMSWIIQVSAAPIGIFLETVFSSGLC